MNTLNLNLVKFENNGYDIVPGQGFNDGLTKLNLGCGRYVLPSFINLDRINTPGVEEVVDFERTALTKVFPPDFFDFILMKDVLEHVPHRAPRKPGEFLHHLVDELIEISKDGAIWQIISPRHPIALRSASHTRIISPTTFDEWTDLEPRASGEHRGTGLERVASRIIFVWNWRDLSRFGRPMRNEVVLKVRK